MRALEEVALSYDQKAEEAAKTTILQSKLDDAELKSDKLSNVIILHIFLLVLKIISIVERRVKANKLLSKSPSDLGSRSQFSNWKNFKFLKNEISGWNTTFVFI